MVLKDQAIWATAVDGPVALDGERHANEESKEALVGVGERSRLDT